MDRALKERIIGAVVLVAIAVLVVPVFLDGPEPERKMITEAVTLPGQNREPGARKTVILQRDRDEPLPETAARNGTSVAAANAHEAEPAAGSEPEEARGQADSADGQDTAAAAPKQAPETEPAEARTDDESEAAAAAEAQTDGEPAAPPGTESTAAESSTGMWAVQLGSFSNKANADRLAANLRKEGYAAFLSRLQTASGELNRVRIGPQKDRESAEAVAARLREEGFKGQVVPHP
ncbi:MAG TPA: SPOR domain-containing protein [Woeseiaceae bacterium]|nr:SPOR domain-containing protein [Woeseiaceae bacterium]